MECGDLSIIFYKEKSNMEALPLFSVLPVSALTSLGKEGRLKYTKSIVIMVVLRIYHATVTCMVLVYIHTVSTHFRLHKQCNCLCLR